MVEPKQTAVPPVAERRPKSRNRVLLGGIIVYSEGSYSINCTIRDISLTGARIGLPKGYSIPSSVYLINIRGQTGHEAQVVWFKGAEAGLAFVSSFDLDRIANPELSYLRRIWAARLLG